MALGHPKPQGGDLMKRLVTLLVLCCCLAVSVFVPAAGATPVPVGGLWQEFHFLGTGSFADACGPCIPSSAGNSQFVGAPPWTFNIGGPGTLTVTDAFLRGDVFEVFDFGVSLATTSAVPTDAGCSSSDPVVCLGVNSSRVYALAPGPHSITIQMVASPYGSGAAYFLPQARPFAGTVGKANCFGQSVAALSNAFGDQEAAAAALGYASVHAMHDAIRAFCNS
jgi:hypothetical protein